MSKQDESEKIRNYSNQCEPDMFSCTPDEGCCDPQNCCSPQYGRKQEEEMQKRLQDLQSIRSKLGLFGIDLLTNNPTPSPKSNNTESEVDFEFKK